MKHTTGLHLSLRNEQRLAILGRLRMAEWIEMPEDRFAREILSIEKDPLFKKLFFGQQGDSGIIRRQRWPHSRASSSLYEIDESRISAGESVQVEEKLDARVALLPKIRQMGRQAFERYFIYCEEALPLEEIARRTGLTLEDARQIHDMLLEIGVEAEFFVPHREPELKRSYSCIARLFLDGEEPGFEFYSPHWARGAYQIRYDLLEEWKSGGRFSGDERKHLPRLLKRLETVNLRQNTIFRILESLSKVQKDYMRTRKDEDMMPVSLRLLAHRLQLAPSTVSRALSGRSIRLPWGKEVPLIILLPGQRRVVRELISRWFEDGAKGTDSSLAERLKNEHGIRVSRRTVNTVRHEVMKSLGMVDA